MIICNRTTSKVRKADKTIGRGENPCSHGYDIQSAVGTTGHNTLSPRPCRLPFLSGVVTPACILTA